MIAASAACPKLVIFPYGLPQPTWNRAVAARGSVSSIVLNVYNGPGLVPYGANTYPLARAHRAGIRVLGYVYTSDGKRPLADVEHDVALWQRWYPVDGFFIDNVTATPAEFTYYLRLDDYIRTTDRRAWIMLNIPAPAREDLRLGNVMNVYEGPAKRFVRFVPRSWMHDYSANRFGSIVYGVAPNALGSVLRLIQSRNIANVYITDRTFSAGPYFKLPSYFAREAMTLRSGGCAGTNTWPWSKLSIELRRQRQW